MKKILLRALMILLYIGLLLYFFQFNFFTLFNFKEFLLTVLGTVILSIPYYNKKEHISKLKSVLLQNVIITGYIETFILLFFKLSAETTDFSNLLKEIALSCRPILYGFIIYVLLNNEEKEKNILNEPIANKETHITLTSEQVYNKFRELGLTKRETEIAKLIQNGLSNREISEELYISETTVKKHVSHIFEKLNITGREQIKELLYNVLSNKS